jgi:hypothetical protein
MLILAYRNRPLKHLAQRAGVDKTTFIQLVRRPDKDLMLETLQRILAAMGKELKIVDAGSPWR